MSFIEVTNLNKAFGATTVLDNLSFTLERGQVLAIIGPSGSGKSTLLRCLNGLERIDSGTIGLLDGQFKIDPTRRVNGQLRQRVGMVFQGFHLWPHRTVLRNLIEAPIQVLKMRRPEAEAMARELLRRVSLADKQHCYPATLSGGEQQRVAIARALAMSPEVLLLDEVTSALDPELVWEVLETIRTIVKEQDRTVIMVTHEIGFAKEMADQVVFLDHGQILKRGTPQDVLDNPTNARIQRFLSRILPGKI